MSHWPWACCWYHWWLALPKTAVFAKVDTATATGLMVILVAVTIVVLPIALPLLLTGISVTSWDIASGLVYLILIPLAISLFVRARFPEAAGSAQPHFTQVSNLSLLIPLALELGKRGAKKEAMENP